MSRDVHLRRMWSYYGLALSQIQGHPYLCVRNDDYIVVHVYI